jgi:hypothetical protein
MTALFVACPTYLTTSYQRKHWLHYWQFILPTGILHIKDTSDYNIGGFFYLPGQFIRKKKVGLDVLDYRALHIFYNFEHSLHIIKLSSVTKDNFMNNDIFKTVHRPFIWTQFMFFFIGLKFEF